MSTYKCIREVYESAADAADTIKREIKHYDADEERQQELVYQEADRLCIYTQDNWDVCNIMRCSDEMETAESMIDMSECTIDQYMSTAAAIIWHELITEALQEDSE
jgi:hypothetical protein